jgi:hypothetical protein
MEEGRFRAIGLSVRGLAIAGFPATPRLSVAESRVPPGFCPGSGPIEWNWNCSTRSITGQAGDARRHQTKETNAMSLLMLLVAWVASGTLFFSQAAQPGAPAQPAPVTQPAPATQPAATAAPAADTSGYVWDAACKDCHSDIHEAWARTKHKTALNRLSAADQETECAGCHLTGSTKAVLEDGKVVNSGVQCESCHGPGRAHAESAKAGTPQKFAKKPGEALCVDCHSSKSPHFHGFFYSAMKPLVHKVQG